MIHITFAPADASLAAAIRDDLARGTPATSPLRIVLLSSQAIADPTLQAELTAAHARGERVVPLLLEELELPAPWQRSQPLDMRGGYDGRHLRAHIARFAQQERQLRRSNRRFFALFAGIATTVFLVAMVALYNGSVAFPVDEYNEEATLQAEWVEGLIGATLEAVQPRTTADAQQFAATYAVAPTRLHFYIRGTATALAQDG